MPLNPPPIVQSNLGIITQQLLRTDMSRAAEVVYALDVTEGVLLANAQDAVNDFQANFVANIGSQLDSEVQILAPTIRLGNGTATVIEATAAGAPTPGGNAGAFVPPNVACLIKKVTSFAGRKNRGRTYLPFSLSTANVAENGSIAAGLVATLQAQALLFLNQLTTDLTPMVIMNKVIDHSTHPPTVTNLNIGAQVVDYLVESVIATQRRRVGR